MRFSFKDPAKLRTIVVVLGAILALGFFVKSQARPNQMIRPPIYEPNEYPIFSSHFTGTPSPFHETVAQLILKGAKLQPPAVAQNLWRQGVVDFNISGYRLPLFIGKLGQPTYELSCVTYGKCNATGVTVHVPAGAASSEDPDHHLLVFDTVNNAEFDGWGGDGDPNHKCNLTGRQITCSWGGNFPFSGNGLDGNSGNSGNNGGYAYGLYLITAQEVMQGHIDHALGMSASCLDNPDIYPADTSKRTDTSCSGGSGKSNPQYGQLIHLKNSYDIAGSTYSPACKTFLTALQDYGAYTYDTNNGYGISVGVEDMSLYASPNPWYTKIFPEMERYGDATGSAPNFRFPTCLNRLSANDIEIFNIAPGS